MDTASARMPAPPPMPATMSEAVAVEVVETNDPKKIRMTSKTRRGLAHMRALLIDSFNPDATPSDRQVKGWTKAKQGEFNQAMGWIEQEEVNA